MVNDFIIPFLAVGLAELGDKTQLAVFWLASKTKNYFHLFSGVILAFAIANGLAVVLGNFASSLIPIEYIRIASGALFILFGTMMIINNKEENTKYEDLKNPFFSSFILIFMSEMGDKSQVTSALFATKFNPILVFLGVLAVLAFLSAIAIFLGKHLAKKLDRKTISYVAGLVFILIGVLFLI